VFGGFIIHWKEHLKETLPILIDAYQSGMEMGEFEYAGYAAFLNGYHSYFIGHELTEIEQKISNYSKAISQIRRERPLIGSQYFCRQFVTYWVRKRTPLY
jgi:predicted ATPase